MDIRRGRRNKVVDVSCFLLFEATGDSESGCNFDTALTHINHIEDDDDHDNDDDAESCSCSTVPGVRAAANGGVREIYSLENKYCNVGGDDYEDEDDDDDDDDGVVEQKEVQLYKKYCRDDIGKENKPSSSAVSVENPNETMNEMEKNRLFWEACLAS